MRRDCYIKI